MNKQEIFNQAYLGLKSQGFQKSIGFDKHENNSTCAYRGENGLKCAVGHLILDEEYDSSYEGISADGLCRGTFLEEVDKAGANDKRIAFVKRIGVDKDEDDELFLDHLQGVHDNSVSPENMKLRLHEFASRKGLTIPEE